MRSMNKTQIIGTLGRDPEVRAMPNGNYVANLAVATDESYNDKTTGQKVEQTEWHRITVYGKLAEICQQYLKKGSRAYFEGKLRTREWEKDGVKRYTTEIIASEMMMLDRQTQGQGQVQGQVQGQGQHQGYVQGQGQQQGYAQGQGQFQGQVQGQGNSAAAYTQQQSNEIPDWDSDVPF